MYVQKTKAVKTENFMKGRQIKDAIQGIFCTCLQLCKCLFIVVLFVGALEVLSSEIHAQHFPAASSRQHREGLVIALFYKVCCVYITLICAFSPHLLSIISVGMHGLHVVWRGE